MLSQKILRLLLSACGFWVFSLHAELQDEIQVYDDSINAPSERGFELHINTTPSGRTTSHYLGEVAPASGLRLTPEFSYGLSKTFEAGLYFPTVLTSAGQYELAGFKLRLKWLPLQSTETQAWFGGINFEASRLAQRYSQSPSAMEARFIFGWRNADWLLAINPIVGVDLSAPYRGGSPDISMAIKATRKTGEGYAAGLEYHSGMGQLNQSLPWQQQDNRLFAVMDVDRKPWVFNLGLGYGLTNAADKWTLKTIFDLPF